MASAGTDPSSPTLGRGPTSVARGVEDNLLRSSRGDKMKRSQSGIRLALITRLSCLQKAAWPQRRQRLGCPFFGLRSEEYDYNQRR